MRLFAMLAAAFSLAHGFAGHYYEAVTRVDGSNAVSVEAWVTGLHAMIKIKESGNPLMAEGSRIVTSDGAKTMYLINDKDKTYSKWDIQALINIAGGAMNSMKGILSMEFTDPDVALLDRHSGGKLLGYDTTYYKYRTTYDIRMKVIGIKRTSQVETIQEVWATDALTDMALGLWLQSRPPSSGNEELDKLIAAEIEKVKGFALKNKTKTITRRLNKKGKVKDETESNSEMEVLTFREEKVATSISDIPADYQEVEMFPTDEKGDGPFKGLFKRDKEN